MANCDGITSGAQIDCSDVLEVGLRQRLFLANRDDVETITYSVTPGEENVITGITMKSGKAFFEFAGVNESITDNTELIRGSVSNGYAHELNFSVFEVDNAQRLNLQGMAYKNQIGITFGPNDSSLGNGIYQVFGPGVGMKLLTNTRMSADAETGGAYVCQLRTGESDREGGLPAVFWDTDEATTTPKIEALLTPAP